MSAYGFCVGGGFGQCAICGETFLKEILFGKKHTSFELNGDTFACHIKCADEFAAKPIIEWPDVSPLKQSITFIPEEATP